MAVLATLLDFVHALLMLAWVVGLPFLFWQRWPRLSRAAAIYAVGFVSLNMLSEWFLGECFITTLTRYCWEHAPAHPPNTEEWFTVRFAELVFSLTPTHQAIKLIGKALVFVTAIGALHVSVSRSRRLRTARSSTQPRYARSDSNGRHSASKADALSS